MVIYIGMEDNLIFYIPQLARLESKAARDAQLILDLQEKLERPQDSSQLQTQV